MDKFVITIVKFPSPSIVVRWLPLTSPQFPLVVSHMSPSYHQSFWLPRSRIKVMVTKFTWSLFQYWTNFTMLNLYFDSDRPSLLPIHASCVQCLYQKSTNKIVTRLEFFNISTTASIDSFCTSCTIYMLYPSDQRFPGPSLEKAQIS